MPITHVVLTSSDLWHEQDRCVVCQKEFQLTTANSIVVCDLDKANPDDRKKICPTCSITLQFAFMLEGLPLPLKWDALAQALEGVDSHSLHPDLAVINTSMYKASANDELPANWYELDAQGLEALESLRSHINYKHLLEICVQWYQSDEYTERKAKQARMDALWMLRVLTEQLEEIDR